VRELHPVQWAIRPLKKYSVFSGRAPRAEYWWFSLGVILWVVVFDFLERLAPDTDLLSAIFNLAIVVPSIAVTVRRLHDTDRPGWWMLIFVAPVVIVTTAAVWIGISGAEPDSLSTLFLVMGFAIIADVIALFVFMARPGTDGPNRYGPDPYGPDNLEEVFA